MQAGLNGKELKNKIQRHKQPPCSDLVEQKGGPHLAAGMHGEEPVKWQQRGLTLSRDWVLEAQKEVRLFGLT